MNKNKQIESKLTQLKDRLESIAFMVSKGSTEKETHAEVVNSLVLLSEISHMLLKPETHEEIDSLEVKKVKSRLKFWVKRQEQINSTILNSFLKLERLGINNITEKDIMNDFKNIKDEKFFESNFLQMKIIAEKNHGKIFEQNGDIVCLWKPIIESVREYEKIIFSNV